MNMINKSSLLLLSITLGALSACTTTPQQAPVVDRHLTPAAPSHTVKPPAPSEDANKGRDERGLYTVKKGDTLIKIALEHGQSYTDIAAWNNLANPNDIKVDQVLRVLPPDNGVVIGKVEPPGNTTPQPQPVVARKSTPRGDKKPYTEGALADLQKPDSDKPDRPEKPAATASVAPPATTPAAPATQLSAEDRELTWIWPSEGRVIATFDEGKNKGIDIAGKPGQHVMAAGAGKVMYAGSGIRGYGNLVIVKHSNSLLSAYAHNRAILVKEGQSVSKGQLIAEMGDSDTDAVKLHFEIRQQGKPVDPSKFLPNR